MIRLLIRLFLFPFGLLYQLINLSNEGARDIYNKIRFRNSIIDPNCRIDNKSFIAKNARILNNTYINNSKVGSYTYIGKNCVIQNATIGSFCSIANDVLIGPGKHPIETFSTSPLFYKKKNPLNISILDKDSNFEEYKHVNIGNDVWIGARVIILDGISLGHGAIIAANSVVTKDILPYTIVGGVPARIIRKRFTQEKIDQLLQSEWWNWEIKTINQQFKDSLNHFFN